MTWGRIVTPLLWSTTPPTVVLVIRLSHVWSSPISTDDDCSYKLSEVRMSYDCDKGVHTVSRLNVSALREVFDPNGLVRDCAEALVCEAQGWKIRRTGQIDDGRKDLSRHAGQ